MRWLLLVCLVVIAHAKPCSYQLPSIDEVVTGVEIDARIENDGHHRTKRSVHHARSEHFQPMRIHLHYDETILSLSTEKLDYVRHALLPSAIGYWEKVLRVRRHKNNLLLKRKCNETFFLWDKSVRQLACGKGCNPITTCGDSIVPPEHLQPCHYCEYKPNETTDRCATEGQPGEGIADTDFVLYVSSKQTERCIRNDTLAYAAHCQQEALLDRPIAGHVNLCPSALSTHTHDQEVLISTVKHEVLHALGFSAGLYAFFRDDDGKPRTKRNQYGRPFGMNAERSHFKWDKTTIDIILRPDWWTAEGPVVHPVQMMVTPRVRAEARRHFGCATLEGAELENQGGEGTAITHWEKRTFENEAMTGTHTQNPVYSRMTFALLEDTGWYRVNYSMAEELHWGAGLGCDFVKKSCGEWIAARKANRTSFSPFCDHVKHDGRRSLVVTKCNLQRDSVALCNLIPYSAKLPVEFRNLDAIPGVQKAGLPYYGGSVELADYCPYNQEFEWKISSETEKRRDSRCEIETNRLENDELMEVYGHNSRCFDFLKPWTERKCGKIRTFHQYMAGCYEHSCMNGILHIGLFNATTLHPCHHEGQHVHIRKITDEGWLREGVLLCPKCSELCGDCAEETEGTVYEDYVGDPPLDEPCSAAVLSLIPTVLLTLIISIGRS